MFRGPCRAPRGPWAPVPAPQLLRAGRQWPSTVGRVPLPTACWGTDEAQRLCREGLLEPSPGLPSSLGGPGLWAHLSLCEVWECERQPGRCRGPCSREPQPPTSGSALHPRVSRSRVPARSLSLWLSVTPTPWLATSCVSAGRGTWVWAELPCPAMVWRSSQGRGPRESDSHSVGRFMGCLTPHEIVQASEAVPEAGATHPAANPQPLPHGPPVTPHPWRRHWFCWLRTETSLPAGP